ncbi:hypothetical protein LF1_16120 [Rubripirellula obstinata]|uniref:Uncharacterized protein n=2 Tax=Rubripirellula obstinata TaxID=406547 RepID=A0A5B1CII1_9BACT|nr:hypothetical protein LF1_16120 [Rubripirellula obstinata]
MGVWMSPDYSDADWKAASEKGIPPAAPWYNLEKNDVPALVNHGLQFYQDYGSRLINSIYQDSSKVRAISLKCG